MYFLGAGLSVESGIPAFSGSGGLWNNHKISDVCSFKTWRKNYNLVTSFYNDLRKDISDKLPHSGFDVFKNLEKKYNVIHYTTNIDDLFEKTGISCEHIHGELTKVICMECMTVSDIGYNSVSDATNDGLILHSGGCNCNLIKPAITFYNESYDNYPGYNNLKKLINTIKPDDTILIVGSSLDVIPFDYFLRHTRCHKYNINPVKGAGFNKDFKHWVNIFEPASTGLKTFEIMMKKYVK